MHYISTRGEAPRIDFEDVLLAGLATDGGLYVPDDWPALTADDLRSLRGRSYADIALRVMQPFVDADGGSGIDRDAFERIVRDTYAEFGHPAVAPLRQMGPDDWLLELFHGPTLAFKDYALQLVGRLFDHVLAKRGERVTIVGATSGDTGSAAIEACRDREAVDIFILFPHGRVSEVQRRQMTTVDAANVHCIAIDGTFDDCQDLVKAMFNDLSFREEVRLSAVNSINWVRVMAQVVYYVAAAVALGAPDRKIAFSVPTGNFGNIFAGYVAHRMGLPVDQFISASNPNDILARFFASGEMKIEGVTPSLSPSMDIQVSSNFERLLFEMMGRDAGGTNYWMSGFRDSGSMSVDEAKKDELDRLFAGGRIDDARTLDVIRETWETAGMLIDPHTAVGIDVGRSLKRDPGVPLVSLATAHPAKFPDAVEKATGVRPGLPPRLNDLFDRPERLERLSNDLDAVMAHVRAHIAPGAAA